MAFSNAQKLTAFYVKMKHQYDFKTFLLQNPPINELRMINYSASDPIQQAEADMEALDMLAHFVELNFDLEEDEEDQGLTDEQAALKKLIKEGSGLALDLATVIEETFHFGDEL